MKNARTGLSVLFGLQGIAMAAWYVPLSPVLEANGLASLRPFAFATSSAAALVTPLFFGAVADRHAPPVTVLRWVTLATAGLMALASYAIGQHWPAGVVLLLIQVQALLSTPTWSLLTSAVLAGVTDAKREFGPIRACGTFGWMVGCLLVSALGADASTRSGFLGAGLWLLVTLATWLVPAVRLPATEGHLTIRERLGLDALELLRIRDHRVIFLTSALLTMPLAAFYPFAPAQLRDLGFRHTSAWMSLAQVTEMVAMFGLGALLARGRLKWILATGLAFAGLRYTLLATHTPAGVLTGISLHGFAFTLYFVTIPIYLNERIEVAWRGRAQALLSLMTQGVGGFVGYLGTGLWLNACQRDELTRWPLFWGVLAAWVAVVLGNFLLNYHDRNRTP